MKPPLEFHGPQYIALTVLIYCIAAWVIIKAIVELFKRK